MLVLAFYLPLAASMATGYLSNPAIALSDKVGAMVMPLLLFTGAVAGAMVAAFGITGGAPKQKIIEFISENLCT